MSLHSSRHWERKGFNTKSANTSGRTGSHASLTDAHLPSCSNIASPVHSRGPAVGDQLLRSAECDRWSVDSPRESGYHSEENSVGHAADVITSSKLHNTAGAESWLMCGEYEMELSLSAETADSLTVALSHAIKAVDCYRQALGATNPSSDGRVRLRMKYNTAVLRSRRLQKHIAEKSSTSSLPFENAVVYQRQSSDSRLARGTAIPGAKSNQRPATHSRECTHGTSIPLDCHHHYSKPSTSQKNSAAVSRMHISKVSHIDDKNLYGVAPVVNVGERVDTDRSASKNGARMTTDAAAPAPQMSPEEAQRLLLARENVRLFETYATLPRKSCRQKAEQRQRQQSTEMPQQRLRVSDRCYDVPRNIHGQKDRTSSSPLCDSLPRLKISWC